MNTARAFLSTVPKKLSERMHRCKHCGYVQDRDANAAQNILKILSQYRARNAMVFGSQARDEEDNRSDFDLLVEFEEPNLLKRIELKQKL